MRGMLWSPTEGPYTHLPRSICWLGLPSVLICKKNLRYFFAKYPRCNDNAVRGLENIGCCLSLRIDMVFDIYIVIVIYVAFTWIYPFDGSQSGVGMC